MPGRNDKQLAKRCRGGSAVAQGASSAGGGIGFATVSMSIPFTQESSEPAPRTARNPAFFIASAQEGEKPCCASKKKVFPQWRYVAADLAAGATAGCAVEAALYPLDTIKTRMQMSLSGGGMKALWQSGGGKALYAGVWGNLAGVAPSSAIFMACYEPIKQWVAKNVGEDKSHLAPLAAGAGAGIAASVVRVPTEVLKQRMQSGEFVKALGAIKAIVAKEGIKGMYAGYGAFLLRDLPFDAIEFFAYEQLKVTYQRSLNPPRELKPLETAVAGAVAGAITGVTTTPFDVLKTRLMTQGSAGTYSSVWDATSKIARTEGLAAFFKGWEPRVIWISIGGCVFFSALEQAKLFYSPKGGEPPAPMH